MGERFALPKEIIICYALLKNFANHKPHEGRQGVSVHYKHEFIVQS